LDRFYGNASWDAQIDVLRKHIDAARETQLPLIIHSVREDEAMAEMLTSETRKGSFPIVMHCYSGGAALAESCLSLGAYFSFSGLLTYEENDHLRAIAEGLPADRILVETDAPSLAPLPHRDERNEPSFIRHTIDVLAAARKASVEEIVGQTHDNFLNAFDKIKR
jgi:TatD DNase family protein